LTFKYEGDFDRVTKGIQGFKELHYKDFLEIAMQLVGKDNKRRLAILVKGTSAPKSLLFTSLKEEELKERSTYNHLD
jgi:insulysin